MSERGSQLNTLSVNTLRANSSLGPTKTRLQQACESKLTEADLGEIVTAIVTKAKTGHLPSAQFVNDVLLGGNQRPQSITVNQFFDGDRESQTLIDVEPLSVQDVSYLQQVTIYLSAAGPSEPRKIAADTGLNEPLVIGLLQNNPQRFNVTGKKFSLAK